MDFYKTIGSFIANGDGADPELQAILDRSDGVLRASRKTFIEVREIIVNHAKVIVEAENASGSKGGAMLASMFMFAIGWQIIAWLWKGVKHAFEQNGSGSPVWRLWKTMEAAFGAADEEEMRQRMAALHKMFDEEDGRE